MSNLATYKLLLRNPAERVRLKKEALTVAAIAGCYLLLFVGLEALGLVFASYPTLPAWYLGTGLTFAILLAFGPQYSPLVIAGFLVSGLWLNALPVSPTQIVIYAITLTAVYAGSALGLRRVMGRGRVDEACRQHSVILMLGALVTSVAAAAVSVLNLSAAGLIHWSEFLDALMVGAMGNAVGILCVAPFFLLVGYPGIEHWQKEFSRPGRLTSANPVRSLLAIDNLVPALVYTVPSVGLLICMFALPESKPFLKLSCIALPLVWIALARGIDGMAKVLFGLTAGAVALQMYYGYSMDQSAELQNLFLVAALNGMLVGAIVTRQQQSRKTDEQRHSILHIVSSAAEHLLAGDGGERGVVQILRQLGETSRACRVYLLETCDLENETALETLTKEWVSKSMKTNRFRPALLNNLITHHLNRRMKKFERGEIYHLEVRKLSGEDQALVSTMGIRSALIVPIIVETQLWGCLGLERSQDEDDWQKHEILAFKEAARSLGALLAKAKAGSQFRELAGTFRAVFWRASSDGRRRTYVSPAYEEIWDQTKKKLSEKPESWLDSIHHEDVKSVEAALEVGEDFEQLYRVVHKDQSERWIRDKGFPVTNESGTVTHLIGIAEDITHQKNLESQVEASETLVTGMLDKIRSGLLVEDKAANVRYANETLCQMLDVGIPKESLLGADSRLVLPKSTAFVDRVEEIKNEGEPVIDEELDLDGRKLRRHYAPLQVADTEFFHVWQYSEDLPSSAKTDPNDKEALLQIIHHRVKTNLQVVNSLLDMESEQFGKGDEPAQQRFKESQNRVRAMALVHEKLEKSQNAAAIDLPEYIRDVTNHLIQAFRTPDKDIRLRLELEPIELDVESAIPCGLILNELVSNSLRHAFTDQAKGSILVRLHKNGDSNLKLTVRDSGPGLSENIDPLEATSVGFKLIRGLLTQVDGDWAYKHRKGSEFLVSVPTERSGRDQGSRSWAEVR
jgi:PAS domain S-box-containing protein